MCSFIRDERGVTEPYTDLPSLGIVAVGLILFAYLLLSAYSSYAASAYYVSVKQDLGHIARAASCDPALSYGPGLLDAHLLDNASKKNVSYGYPDSTVQITVRAQGYEWRAGEAARGRAASHVLPVSVRLNDARCVPGTLKVTMWEG